VSCAKTAEAIEMSFSGQIHAGQRKSVLNGDHPQREGIGPVMETWLPVYLCIVNGIKLGY